MAASLYETFAAITASFHERGILITAGTDLINPWMTPGVALHEEMRLLHDAGLSSLDVLATATSNSAQAMGLPETGALRTGYAADLVVLSANPLENIENTRSIQMVIKSGKGYLPGDLIF